MSIDQTTTGQDVELMLNAWRKHNARTGKNETLLHYIHSQMCPDCRAKYVAEGEKHLARKTTHFYLMMQHREEQKYSRGGHLDVRV